jgi:hypothetical protein
LLAQNVNFSVQKFAIMSNEVILERKKPHFISTEFKVQRIAAEAGIHDDSLNRTANILKGLVFTALASIVYVMFNKKQKVNKKNKEALAYEVW